jgi:hypothetical protein
MANTHSRREGSNAGSSRFVMRSKMCVECDQLWAVYVSAVMGNVYVMESALADKKAHDAANRAWRQARSAYADHIATHQAIHSHSRVIA